MFKTIESVVGKKVLCDTCKQVEKIIKEDGPLVSVCTKCGKVMNKIGLRVCGNCARRHGVCQRCGGKF